MIDQFHKQGRAFARTWIVVAAFWLVIATALLMFQTSPIFAAITTRTITTLDDFNGGFFYHTGTTAQSIRGGDGDGEIRLQTHGISPGSWNHNGNATNLPAIHSHGAVYTNTFIYIAAGSTVTDVNGSGNIYYSQVITTNHNLSNWTLSPYTLSVKIYQPGMVSVGNYLYVVGGYSGTVAINKIYRAQIGANGVPGSWSEMSATLPAGRTDFATVVISGTIYVVGGTTDGATAVDTIYYAKPDASGNIASWATATTHLNRVTAQHAVATYNGALYVMGGTDYTTSYNNTEFVFPDSNGDITHPLVSTTTPLLNNRILGPGLAFAGEVYFVGGAINLGGTGVDYISSGLIEPNGTISSTLGWQDDSLFSTPRTRLAAVTSDDGWIYAIGGFNLGTPLQSIDYGPTSSTGSAYVPSGTYTSRVIDLGSTNTVSSLKWNTFVSTTVSMTLQYKLGNSPDLSSVAWSGKYGATQNNSTVVTNTINTSGDTTKYQYFQFRVDLSTQNNTGSPVLNAVQILYDVPAPTPTPTPTGPTPTIVPGHYPDLILSGLEAPSSQSTMTYTINVSVTNWGTTGFNRMPQVPVLSKTARVGQQSGPRGAIRKLPTGVIRTTQNYTGTTNFFVWVDVYADSPSLPTIPSDVGNCPALGGGINFAFVYALGVGETVNVPLDCYLTAGSHTFFAQVDTCDNPPNGCSPTYGYVLEKSETNNIAGPLLSGQKWQAFLGWLNPIFLPQSSKSQ